MRASELREMTIQELEERLSVERDHLHELRMAHAISPLENPMQFRATKKVIAQILTVITEKRQALE